MAKKEVIEMARRNQNAEVEVPEVDETETVTETTEEAKPAKASGPKRGTLPEGFVTPHQFAKELTDRELHTDRNGGHEVRPQMVYSYIKNAASGDPFPLQTVTDSNGVERKALNLEEGLAWWARKNERVSTRKQNAAEKQAAKEKRAQEKAQKQEAEGETPEPAVEAE